MTLVKHEIPLLEYDDDKDAVVSPRHENLPIALPERAAYVFSEQAVERYAEKTGAKIVAHFESATKLFPVYVVEYKGTDLLARAFCHEIDHLDGKLYVDIAEDIEEY